MRSRVNVSSLTRTAAFCVAAVVFCTAACILLLFCSTRAFGYTYEERFDRTLSAEGVSSLKLGNTNGTVRVVGWERDEISVEATKKVRARNREEAEKIAEALRIEIGREDGVVRIETIYPKRGDGGFWSALFGGGVTGRMSVEYEVYVPRKMDLELHTTNGRVEVEEVSGEVATHTTNGRIVLRDVEGSVRARTTNGGIDIVELVGTFDVSTTNGSIEVAWSRGGAGDCRAHTTNGRIRIELPEDFSAVLDASTTNGRVRTEIPLTIEGTITKRKVRGTLGEGGPLLKLGTTNGNIDIVEAGRAEGRVEPEPARLMEEAVEETRAAVEEAVEEARAAVEEARAAVEGVRVMVPETRSRRAFRRRRGDEVRFVGSVVIEEDEVVEGDVTTIGGSITVLGKVDGDVTAVFGGVKLGPKAVVDGDVTSVGGKTEVAEGARVSGDVTEASWRGARVSERNDEVDVDLDVEGLWDRGEDLPTARCFRTSEPPTIDGRVDDAVWEWAGRLRDFRLSDGRGRPQEPTKGFLLWDAEYLYVGVQCWDEEIHRLMMNQRGRDAPVWNDDDVEVFLSGDEEPEPYYQFAVNPRGTFFDQVKESDRSGERHGWSSDTEVAAYVGDDFWSVEMAIPWDDVEGTPKVGDSRRLNIQRKQHRLREYSFWSPTYRKSPSPHLSSRFGILRFMGESFDSLRTGIPCSGIEVEGNAAVTSEEILAAIRLKVGDVLTGDVLMDVEDALWELRWFSDVDVALKDVEKGAVVLISVKEKPTVEVSEVEVVDGEAFSLEAIRERSGLKPGRYTEEDLDRACERVADLYRDKGYKMASVSRAYEPESGWLTITVDEGRIEEIRVVGARFVEEDDIRKELGIWEGQLYVSQQIGEALDRMKQGIGKFREVSHSIRDGVLTVLVKEERPLKSDTDLTVRFNRVESLFIGADVSASTVFGLQGTAYLSGGYSLGTEKWQYTLGAEKSWFRTYRSAIGANVHDVVDTPDRWKVDDDEASGLAICGFEPRDYFQRWGTEVYWTQRLEDFGTFKVSYVQDEYESVAKNTNWSLFNSGHTKRPNPPVDEGRMKSLKASWTVRPRFEGKEGGCCLLPGSGSCCLSSKGAYEEWLLGDQNGGGWLLWAEGEIAGEEFGGDFEFKRIEADARRAFRLAPEQILRLRVRAGTSEGTLPTQKRFALGGIGTLPGYGYKEFEGNRMVLANVEYRFGGDAALVPFLGAGRVWGSGEETKFEDFKSNAGVAFETGNSEDSRLRLSWAIPTGRPARKGRWTLRFDQAF